MFVFSLRFTLGFSFSAKYNEVDLLNTSRSTCPVQSYLNLLNKSKFGANLGDSMQVF